MPPWLKIFLFGLLLGWAGCNGEQGGLPSGFLFGTTATGFKGDMGCPTLPGHFCTDSRSDWYAFATSPETIADSSTYLSGQDPAVVGPGQWELIEEDLDRAVDELSNNAMKISIEWSRIFPYPTDGIEGFDNLRAAADPRAVAHYHNLLAAMRRRGLEPLVTLNYFTLPVWIHDAVGCHQNLWQCTEKGWVDGERTVREIAKYAGYVAAEFGAQVDTWITLRSPFEIVFFGYVWPSAEVTHPPALMMREGAAHASFGALVEAHARMYDAVKANDLVDADSDGHASRVGIDYTMTPTEPKNPEDLFDPRGSENVFYLWNTAYLDSVVLGMFDGNVDGIQEYRQDLDNRMDFIGLSAFIHTIVTGTRYPVFPDLTPLTTFDPLAIENRTATSETTYELLMWLHRRYRLPLIITESSDIDPHDDGRAPRFIISQLDAVQRASRRGVDIRGYIYGEIVDSFSWNRGTTPPSGLYAVDSDDPQKPRTPRQGAAVYGRIAAEGQVPEDLRILYPAE